MHVTADIQPSHELRPNDQEQASIQFIHVEQDSVPFISPTHSSHTLPLQPNISLLFPYQLVTNVIIRQLHGVV
jgi:hypothetical protein